MESLVFESIPFYKYNSAWVLKPYSQSNDEASILGFHIATIMNKHHLHENDIPRILEKRNDYCISCGKLLEVKSNTPRTCGSKQCLYSIEEILVGDYVTTFCKEEPFTSVFHLYSASNAIYSDKSSILFEPYPLYFLKEKISLVRGSINSLETTIAYQDMERIKILFPVLTIGKAIDLVKRFSSYRSDIDMRTELGTDYYRIIRFIIMSAKTKLTVSANYKEVSTMKKTPVLFQVPTDPIEDKDWNSAELLYHGSLNKNWFSIVRNGLISMSSTSLRANGSAYGNGIYLSSDFTYSRQYTERTGDFLMGVFQVRNSLDKYKKTQTIYVVPEMKDVRLRAILLYPSSTKENDSILNFDLNTLKQSLQQHILPKSTGNSKATTRLMKEFQLMKSNTDLGFSFELQQDNLHAWLVKLDSSTFGDSTNLLIQDMKQYNVNEIVMEILFEDNYPFVPPFVRIISPRFRYQTGHITSGGSICMELLCVGHWKPICSLESLIIQIKVLLLEGGGRLDPVHHTKPYSLKESQDSFVRVGKSHGWL